jgi:serine/threonine-protein kinase
MELYFGQSVFGGTLAAPIWHDYMSRIMVGLPAESFPAPPPPQFGSIPDVVGMKVLHAQDLLVKANFTPQIQTVGSALPSGTVISETPAGGASAQLGALVTLEVSSGVPGIVKIPDVVGLPQADATTALQAAGFLITVVEQHVSDVHSVGSVLTQDPAGGVKATQGTTVTITVGTSGYPSPSPTPSSTPSPTPAGTPSPSP